MSGKRWPGWAVGWAGLGWAGLGWDRDIGDQMVTRGPGHKSGDTLALEQTGHADHGFWIELQTNYRHNFHNPGEGPSWLKALTSAFIFKTLLGWVG